jgi:hypothetical protein
VRGAEMIMRWSAKREKQKGINKEMEVSQTIGPQAEQNILLVLQYRVD